MKKLTFLLIILVFPFAGICQGNIDIEKEKAAIKAVIEKETNATYAIGYNDWASIIKARESSFIQDETFIFVGGSKDFYTPNKGWGTGMYSPEGKDSLINEAPAPTPYENTITYTDYTIKLYPESAWAFYHENHINTEGETLMVIDCTRFLEKVTGEWKINFVSYMFKSTWNTETESANMDSDGFIIPQLTDTQKLQMARRVGNNNIIAAINFAKSQGLTAEEYGEYEGKLFPWNKEDGFEKWINGFLYMNTGMVENIEILNQAENKITIRMSQIYPAFESRGEIMSVTFEEYLQWYEKAFTVIFNNLDCNYSQVLTDKGVEITIKKN